MQIILLERVEKLGQMGDVVRVKDGYARNYLLPQKKALRATEDNMASFEKQKSQLEATNLDRRTEAEAVAEKLDGLKCVILRQASEGGQLYGSVNSRDIAQAVTEAGFTIDRKQIQLTATIKTIAIHDVRVALHPEVSVGLTVNVARSEAEAKIQDRGADPEAAEAEGDEIRAAEEFFETAELAAEADGDAGEPTTEPEGGAQPAAKAEAGSDPNGAGETKIRGSAPD